MQKFGSICIILFSIGMQNVIQRQIAVWGRGCVFLQM